jgi:hypothetical protein
VTSPQKGKNWTIHNEGRVQEEQAESGSEKASGKV